MTNSPYFTSSDLDSPFKSRGFRLARVAVVIIFAITFIAFGVMGIMLATGNLNISYSHTYEIGQNGYSETYEQSYNTK